MPPKDNRQLDQLNTVPTGKPTTSKTIRLDYGEDAHSRSAYSKPTLTATVGALLYFFSMAFMASIGIEAKSSWAVNFQKLLVLIGPPWVLAIAGWTYNISWKTRNHSGLWKLPIATMIMILLWGSFWASCSKVWKAQKVIGRMADRRLEDNATFAHLNSLHTLILGRTTEIESPLGDAAAEWRILNASQYDDLILQLTDRGPEDLVTTSPVYEKLDLDPWGQRFQVAFRKRPDTKIDVIVRSIGRDATPDTQDDMMCPGGSKFPLSEQHVQE